MTTVRTTEKRAYFGTALIIYLMVILFGQAMAEEFSTVESDFSAEFGPNTGSFSLLDEKQHRWIRYHSKECMVRSSPCSTFKVLNSLIALETGVAADADFSLPWDGTQYSIESWNRDQTLRSAFSSSCGWYYRNLASRVSLERYQQILSEVSYGNGDLSGGITGASPFWLQSSLLISPDEQVDFLRRLHDRKLPFSEKSVDTVLDIMTISRQDGFIFRGKTGTAGDVAKGIAPEGWFIGIVTTPSNNYFFATRMTGENSTGPRARKVTEAILSKLEILTIPK